MINEYNGTDAFAALNAGNPCDGKILSLYNAYGNKYDFCKFFLIDGETLAARLDDDFMIQNCDGINDAGELAAFLNMGGFGSVFLPEKVCSQLEKTSLKANFRHNSLMEYKAAACTEFPPELRVNPPADELFEVLKTGFSLNYNSWYPDISHRIRHGVSTTYLYKNASTVTAMYDLDGNVFLSMVATKTEMRGKGTAKEMLSCVCGKYKSQGKRSILVCRKAVEPFYIKSGFERIGGISQIYAEN